MSRKSCISRFTVLAITLSLAGASFYLFVFKDVRWRWDEVYLVLLGTGLGQSVGIYVMSRVPRRRDSEGPAFIGNAVGILVMVLVWLFLSEDAVRVLSHIARAILGGFIGFLMAYITKPYPDRGQSMHSRPECVGQDRPSAG
jgi:predicted MFS family arabinose efflux permease